jgi:hypothetical protein
MNYRLSANLSSPRPRRHRTEIPKFPNSSALAIRGDRTGVVSAGPLMIAFWREVWMMLTRSPNSTLPEPIKRKQRAQSAISGQRVAKNHLGQRFRAELGALWIIGSLDVSKPTFRQASLVFNVCEALIRRALRQLEAATTAPASQLEVAWAKAGPIERDAFTRQHLAELWDGIDQATR